MIILVPLCDGTKFFQTRLDQITQQLETRMSDFEDAGDTESASQSPGHESYGVTEIDSEVWFTV